VGVLPSTLASQINAVACLAIKIIVYNMIIVFHVFVIAQIINYMKANAHPEMLKKVCSR